MKRLLFAVLMMVCSVSWAEWEKSGEANDYTVYSDKSTVRKKEKIATIWEMYDYSVVQTNENGYRYNSEKVLLGYNCMTNKVARISTVYFSGSMGDGYVVASETEKKLFWGSVHLTRRLKIACGEQ